MSGMQPTIDDIARAIAAAADVEKAGRLIDAMNAAALEHRIDRASQMLAMASMLSELFASADLPEEIEAAFGFLVRQGVARLEAVMAHPAGNA